MQLKYIWIKKYKNLEKIGFNLNNGSDEIFEYVNGKLLITKIKDQLPPDFYAKNIKGITAIVGKNGSGKTNFSEFLNYNLAHARNGTLSTYIHGEGIIVFEDRIFIQKDILLLNEEGLKDNGYKVSRFKNAPLDDGTDGFHWSNMEKNKYIYYNPNFDLRELQMGWGDNLVNISTNHLLSHAVYQSAKHKLAERTSYRQEMGTDPFTAFYRNEKLRESELILNYPFIRKLIKSTPTILKISIDHTTENNMLNLSIKDQEDNDEELVRKRKDNINLLENIEKSYNGYYSRKEYKVGEEKNSVYHLYKVPKADQKKAFKVLFFVKFFRIYLFLNQISFENDFLWSFIHENKKKYKDVKDFDELFKLKESLNMLANSLIWDESQRKVNDGNYDSYEKRGFDMFNLFRNATLDISKIMTNSLFQGVVSKTKSLLNGNLHFHYEFSHKMSSGEQNLLNFYSRFYWAKQEVLNSEKDEYGIKGKRIVVFIDEGEIALHPEWQRKYFKLAIDYISNLFKDREIQLILTTHSPFVLSDIPKEHIIFLKQNEKTGKAEIANINRDKTFGANIYTLLSDSFFMEEGTIGDFAKEKIEEVLTILSNSTKLRRGEKQKIENVLEILGEPLIKMQLEGLRMQKEEASKITEMQKRIDELEAREQKRGEQ